MSTQSDIAKMEGGLSRLMDNPDFQEFIVEPNLASGKSYKEQAETEACKPVGQRNDALVVELLKMSMWHFDVANYCQERLAEIRAAKDKRRDKPALPNS